MTPGSAATSPIQRPPSSLSASIVSIAAPSRSDIELAGLKQNTCPSTSPHHRISLIQLPANGLLNRVLLLRGTFQMMNLLVCCNPIGYCVRLQEEIHLGW